jgi:hypothetical protein
MTPTGKLLRERRTMKWIYLEITSNTGKVLYACSECGYTTPAPTKTHVCGEAGLEMNQRREGQTIPQSAYEV